MPERFAKSKQIIIDNHQRFERHQTESYKFAKICGDKLHWVKQHLKHGEWGDWMADNIPFGSEAANFYMRVSENWPAIQRDLAGGELSLQVIKKYLQKSKQSKHGGLGGQLLEALEAIKSGLSPREIIEQSTCFVFQSGRIFTYNDDVSCSIPIPRPIEELTCAVQAQPLLHTLRLGTSQVKKISLEETDLVLSGPHQRTCIRAEQEIRLPLDKVEQPDEWRRLDPRFWDAIKAVLPFAGEDESEFKYTCVHFHPKYLEASDNYQLCRYAFEMGIKKPALLRHRGLKELADMQPVRFAETENWLHFENEAGTVISCRRYMEPYPDLTSHLKVADASTLTFPKSLDRSLARAEVFSAEDKDYNAVIVELEPGKMKITGEGSNGHSEDWTDTSYDGPRRGFATTPNLLRGFAKLFSQVEVTDHRMKGTNGDFTVVATLGEFKNGTKNATEEDDEDDDA